MRASLVKGERFPPNPGSGNLYDTGEVIENGDPERIRQSERVRHAYMGTAAETVADPLAEEDA